jgi:hypothetical protein
MRSCRSTAFCGRLCPHYVRTCKTLLRSTGRKGQNLPKHARPRSAGFGRANRLVSNDSGQLGKKTEPASTGPSDGRSSRRSSARSPSDPTSHRPAVNRLVAGSNPARGANKIKYLMSQPSQQKSLRGTPGVREYKLGCALSALQLREPRRCGAMRRPCRTDRPDGVLVCASLTLRGHWRCFTATSHHP